MDVQEINPRTYKKAGRIAIIAGILMWLQIVFVLLGGLVAGSFSFKFEALSIIRIILTIYPLWRFRGLLNDSFQFHSADGLIKGLIIIHTVMILQLAASLTANFLVRDAAVSPQLTSIPGILISRLTGIVASIAWIVLAVRLLRLQDDLRGMLRPFAIMIIVANAVCLTIILTTFGALLHSVCIIMLGVIFLRMANPPTQVDFV